MSIIVGVPVHKWNKEIKKHLQVKLNLLKRNDITLIISIHSSNYDRIFFSKELILKFSKQNLSYDENVTSLMKLGNSNFPGFYLILVAWDDHIVEKELKQIKQKSKSWQKPIILQNKTKRLSEVRWGFLSTGIYQVNKLTISNESSNGWQHCKIILDNIHLGYDLIDNYLVEENLNQKKVWHSNGNFIRYQIALAELTEKYKESEISEVIKEAAIGGWPRQIIYAFYKGFRPSFEEFYFIKKFYKKRVEKYSIIVVFYDIFITLKYTLNIILKRF